MRLLPAFCVLLGLLCGCSGGGGGGPATDHGNCATGARAMCLNACSVGCTQQGCELTQIAQNQPLTFVFSQDVDPLSVTTASCTLKTATGEEPLGVWVVHRQTITFVPELRVVGSQSFFGFKAHESYVLGIRGGTQGDVVRATSGDRLPATLTCTLAVTRGVLDLDERPPAATLLTPSSQFEAPRDTAIVLGFSEVLDPTPFAGANTRTGPVRLRVRRAEDQGGTLVCTDAPAPVEAGYRLANDLVQGRTTLTIVLPGQLAGRTCVEVEITPAVRDLAGTPATAAQLYFVTTAAPSEPQELVETFADDRNLDRAGSGGTWGGGRALPPALGSDGRLGDLDWREGRRVDETTWEFSTDAETFDRTKTQSGELEVVNDGVFRFASFVLPRGITLRFTGRAPVRLLVRGNCDVQGTLDLAAADLQPHAGGALGQSGGIGGPGGGNGGAGAAMASGSEPGFDGRPGEDVRLLAGHAYAARAAGTGGAGSRQNPPQGTDAEVRRRAAAPNENWFGFVLTTAAGGGGGGNVARGGDGTVLAVITNLAADRGPDAAGGRAFDPFPLVAGTGTVDQLLIGGAGGGGGASVPTFSHSAQVTWRSAAGGAGGGGTLGVRAGGDFACGAEGRIVTRGGAAARTNDTVNYPVPGGGGAGGAIVLQVGRGVRQQGLLDRHGGAGGENLAVSPPTQFLHAAGGGGASGWLRLEVAGTPSLDLLGRCEPPATPDAVGALREHDRDTVTGQRSRWYDTRQLTPPTFVRYEVEADVDGLPVRYSDDPARGVLAAPGQAVRFLVQGGRLDPSGALEPGSTEGFRTYVGRGFGGRSLDEDRKTALRFVLLFDTAVARTIAVRSVRVFFRS